MVYFLTTLNQNVMEIIENLFVKIAISLHHRSNLSKFMGVLRLNALSEITLFAKSFDLNRRKID